MKTIHHMLIHKTTDFNIDSSRNKTNNIDYPNFNNFIYQISHIYRLIT